MDEHSCSCDKSYVEDDDDDERCIAHHCSTSPFRFATLNKFAKHQRYSKVSKRENDDQERLKLNTDDDDPMEFKV